MEEDILATLETLYEAYADNERKKWEEQGKPDKHVWWAWQRIGKFIDEEKARWEQPDEPE